MPVQAARADIELRMLEAMVDCAHTLGVGFGEAAAAEPDLDRRMALDAAFHRGFLAVRMGIRLSLALRAGRAPAAVAPVREPRDEPEVERAEGLDRERLDDPPDRERERDREREYEPVSLPRFLATLRGVAADAGRLPVGAHAAVRPKLENLLAQAGDRPPAATAGLALGGRPSAPPARARFLGSAAPSVTLGLVSRPRPPPHASG